MYQAVENGLGLENPQYRAVVKRRSGEDYLKAVLILNKKVGMARLVDLARHMGYSKSSISHAVSILCKGGFLVKDDSGFFAFD